ncbi:MAG: hypothetical protein FWC50_11825 [Planctomycetaceae bacterium]|nr:hypothetical protein [Planctomycetaceae bacterium]
MTTHKPSPEGRRLLFRIRCWLLFFMAALLASGLTAFPLRLELGLLCRWFGEGTFFGGHVPGLTRWLEYVRQGLEYSAEHYPFLAYGTDWLAFAHIVITISFLGPLRDPVRNIWVIQFGMIACLLIVPLALICGPIRGIPFAWQLIDCSFGIFGIVPLVIVYRMTRRLEKQEA